MNERIQNLKDKIWTEEYWSNPNTDKLLPAQLNKFAELIVGECCRALNPMLRDMISRGQGVDMIKLHFGMDPNKITTAMLDTAIEQCKQELTKTKSGEE